MDTAPHGCRRTGTRSFHATYSRTPVASHFAITGPSASLAFGSFSHDGWFRKNVCCEGRATLGITSLPATMVAVTASSVPSSDSHPAWASTSAVTRVRGIIGRPCSSRRNAMKSGSISRQPLARLVSASQRMRMRWSAHHGCGGPGRGGRPRPRRARPPQRWSSRACLPPLG